MEGSLVGEVEPKESCVSNCALKGVRATRVMVWWGWAIAVVIVGATGVLVAACDASPRAAGSVPFTSADGAFGFHYAAELVKCEAQDAKVTSESVWAPAEACRCNDPGGAAVTAVCFGYPKDKYKDKPTFNGASFFVATDPSVKDAAGCTA
jgi:hypothetical protein